MAGEVIVLGVRHHGPGSARMVLRALETTTPDAVLIEGPPDAADVLSLAAHEDMTPPVALLVYEPDTPIESVCYPYAEFSPEWQALRWGLAHKAETRFIDLPHSMRPRRSVPEPAPPRPESGGATEEPPDGQRLSPLDELASAAGFADGEAWWGRFIEEHRGQSDPVGLFDAIREAMASAREAMGHSPHDPDEAVREAHMRRAIRAAMRAGHKRIAVVCGAWHAPVLTAAAIKERSAKEDDELLKAQPKRKTAATWIPWTYDRLASFSGYGAGITSPGWYEHLWVHPAHLSETWLTRVARLMRDEGLDASPASVIESVRLADSLAALRGRSIAGLDELGEATLSILCHGNILPIRVIEERLIVGQRLGRIPEECPAVPLQRDLAALQKSLRLKVTADATILDLDQRKETDLERSRLLHRLRLLKIGWGELEIDRHRRTSTFHEIWRLQWKPELAVAVIEAARWGNTVHEAAIAYVSDRAAGESSLSELATMLDGVVLADLPSVVERLVARIQEVSAISADIGHLMEALPPLVRVLRYGSVRKTDAALIEPVAAGLLARICIGLVPACGSLDDDAARAMQARVEAMQTALANLDLEGFLDPWRQTLGRLGDADIHGLVAGRACRILLDDGAAPAEASATRLSLALSRGNDAEKASSWLEGFLGGSGLVLVHDDQLLGIVDRWVSSLTRETFEQICPIARRTFSTFASPERRQIGEGLRNRSLPETAPQTSASDTFDPGRAALVEPVLRLILGARYP